MEWLSDNAVGLLGVLGALTVAAVAVYKARYERRANRLTIASESAMQTMEHLYEAVIRVNSDNLIVFANQQARFLTGYREGELLGMHVNDLVPPRHRKEHLVHMQRYRNSPYPRQMGTSGMRLFLLDKLGYEKRVQISLRPVESVESEGTDVILELRVVPDDTPVQTGSELDQ